MKSRITKLFIVSLILTIFASTEIFAQEEAATEKSESSAIGISVGIDYWSNYLWRGSYWYQGDGAFFITASYDILGSGAVISVGEELSEDWMFDGDETLKDIHSTDFGIDYSYTFSDMLTLGVGFWYFMMWEPANSFGTAYVSLCLSSILLSPTLTYNHDFYPDKDDLYDEDFKDFYIQLGISHSFALYEGVALDLGAVGGYYKMTSGDLSGISDIDLSAGLSVTKGILTYGSSFHYVIVPSKDFYGTAKDINRFYASFGVTCSI